MRVAMYYRNSDIRLEKMETPRPGPGDLLVKIQASGICGSDVMEWYRLHKAPLILGHEIAGEVVGVGAGVTAFQPGDRVIATHHVPCFSCHLCRSGHETVCDLLLSGTHFDPGGFCEYVRLPAVNVERGTWRLPETVSYDEATFVEPLACVLRGQRLAGMRPAASVLVLGSGLAGLLHINLAGPLRPCRPPTMWRPASGNSTRATAPISLSFAPRRRAPSGRPWPRSAAAAPFFSSPRRRPG